VITSRRVNPVVDLVLACTRFGLRKCDQNEIAQLVRSDLDWSSFVRFTMAHSIVPEVVSAIAACDPALIPRAVRHELYACDLANRHKALRLAHQLVAIVHYLDTAGIATLAFKGPSLAIRAYGDPGGRQFEDLDLLVARAQVEQAIELLRASGYTMLGGERRGDLEQIRDGAVTLLCSNPQLASVDLHWRIAPAYFPWSPTTEWLLERSSTVQVLAHSIKVPGVQDLILALCVHGTKHWWRSLQLVCDVAQVLAMENSLDPEELLQVASANGLRRILLVAVSLAHEMIRIDGPPTLIASALGDRGTRSLSSLIQHNLFSPTPRLTSVLREWTIPARSLTGMWAGLRYLTGRAFGPKEADWNSVYLPPLLSPLYRVVHPLRALARRIIGSGGEEN
jgi:hypothetical protein